MTTKITEQNISELANAGVNWQSVFTGDGSTGLTVVAGRGYFIDTTSGTVEVTLPASPSAGDVVVLKDYARTWSTNAVSLASTLMDGSTTTTEFSTQGQTVTLVYMDGTKGWSIINEDTTTSLQSPAYVAATGGTINTSGDYKIHTFTGDGCFVVSCAGNENGSDTVDYLVVAGGGSGGRSYGGGGGAGGYRESHSTPVSGCYTASPLATCTGITVTATTYPITVGGGGAGVGPGDDSGTTGSNSIFSTITSAGGGGGATNSGGAADAAKSGGSGGGGGYNPAPTGGAGGSGNTPAVSPPQGNNGGTGYNYTSYGAAGGGGGGASGNGSDSQPTCGDAGPGANGVASSITGSPVTRAGGGGGGAGFNTPGTFGSGGSGGGTAGKKGCAQPATNAGTANTGGGSGGGSKCGNSGNGGKGIVILRYKFQ